MASEASATPLQSYAPQNLPRCAGEPPAPLDSPDAGAMPPARQFFPHGTHRIPMRTVSPPHLSGSDIPHADRRFLPYGECNPRARDGCRVKKQNRAIPACRWAPPMSRPCCSRKFLKFDAADPHWPDRDRFILSAGHGSMLLYALMYLTGQQGHDARPAQEFPPAQLEDPRAIPRTSSPHGVETTTGPLGQGIATSVGFALAERLLARSSAAMWSITTPMCCAPTAT